MDEHHWTYRPSTHSEGVAQDFQQQLKATTETPSPSICALRNEVWCHVVGPWVAEEMLRLATANKELERKLAFHMKEAANFKAKYAAERAAAQRLKDLNEKLGDSLRPVART